MLDVKTRESDNYVYVSGVLNEMEIIEANFADGSPYVKGTASIAVDQDINGKVVENIIPVKMFAALKKRDGGENPMYSRIVGYKDAFISRAAAEDPSQASRITVKGKVEENCWYSSATDSVVSIFQISSNFLNKQKEGDKEEATFRLSGVVGSTRPEMDKNGEETGRLIVTFIVIGYGGKANKIEMIAEGNAKAHIETNWEKGDTVQVTGKINMVQKVETWKEEQGFGEPIERSRTVSVRELIVTGGSATGLEESLSYDMDSVKLALNERNAKNEEKKNSASTTKSIPKSKNADFGF